MSEIIGTIQKIVQNAIEGMKLSDMATGVVVSTKPLSVQTDASMPPIPSAGLVLTEGVKPKTVSVQGGGGGTVVLNSGLAVGDKVLMLRVSNGQRYIILSIL